ncbi:helix-turn-helix domain-containing protein [Pontibacter sp. KCTC 32443]|uniref:helix-turn-helix domain-containing protein n=1 Tax=Pontibacter TaxID=323449 RepID=UPI00164DA3EA|nr:MULTISPECIES: helix-turn-helix domain-containing protein [Pontibacter]MBC5772758.1 helix-turn-helix domain-containing protein [Pontibacter sp. KCTC 32443]
MVKRPNNKSVLPAIIRFHLLLLAAEKLLYGELVALCGRIDHCWPSNRYLAALYGVSTKSIYRWLKKLEKLGLIRIVLNKEQFNRRDIYLMPLPETSEDQHTDSHVPGAGHLRPAKKESLFIYNKNDSNNDKRNGEREWKAKTLTPTTTLESFTFLRGHFPTLEQVHHSMMSQSGEDTPKQELADEAKRFFNHYTSNGWMVGKAPMRDLQASVAKWLDNAPYFNKQRNPNYEQHSRYNPKQSPYAHLHTKRYDSDTF